MNMTSGFLGEAGELAVGGEIAGTQPLSALESIVQSAVRACGADAAVLSFTNRKLRWLSTSRGLDESRTCQEMAACLPGLATEGEFLFNRSAIGSEYPPIRLHAGGREIQSAAGTLVPSRWGKTCGMMFALDHRADRMTRAHVEILRDLAAVAGAIVDGWLYGDWNTSAGAEHRYHELFENTRDVIFLQNLTGELTAINRTAERLLGYRREELVGKMLSEIVVPEQADVVHLMALEQFGGGGPQTHSVRFLSKQNGITELDVTPNLLFEQGKPVGMMGFARESRAMAGEGPRKPAPDEVGRASSAVKHLYYLNNAAYGEMSALFDDHLRAGCEILGVEIGMIGELQNGELSIRARTRHSEAPPVGTALKVNGSRFSASVRLRKARTYRSSIPRRRQPIYRPGAAGFFVSIPLVTGDRVWGVFAFASREPLQEVNNHLVSAMELVARCLGQKLAETEVSTTDVRRSATRSAEHSATRDSVTGLANSRVIRRRLEESVEIARTTGAQFAVVLVDLDHFKRYNDALGYSVGDRLLCRAGERLRKCLGNSASVGHMDADRYLCVLHHLEDQSEANRIVRRMLAEIRRPFSVMGMDLFATASFGISVYPKDGEAAASLLWNAETALHQAKADGRDRLAFFTPQHRPAGLQVQEIADGLLDAIANNEFELRFQPQIDMDGRLRGLETLLTWHHARLGRVPAEEFIPVAEETGLIVPIGAWVIRQACRRGSAWRRRGLAPVKLAVNVSALQFAQADFTDIVAEALTDTAMPASLLELEVTESAVMRDIHQSAKVMAALQKLGVEIAIDDFGTGYSSLSYLRQLPANALKIDRSFLEDSDSPMSTRALIETIVGLAHDLGLSVVGEGVETPEQFDLLRRAGCDRAQGHLFGHPLSSRKAAQLLREAKHAGTYRDLRYSRGKSAHSE